jgi:His-Xaa-Ser system protein HxsD
MSSTEGIVLSFATEGQDEAPLRAAAYRMVGSATCEVDMLEGKWVCKLSGFGPGIQSAENVKQQFIAILNDENLREQIESRVAPMRNVIVALAFGALARDRLPAA